MICMMPATAGSTIGNYTGTRQWLGCDYRSN